MGAEASTPAKAEEPPAKKEVTPPPPCEAIEVVKKVRMESDSDGESSSSQEDGSWSPGPQHQHHQALPPFTSMHSPISTTSLESGESDCQSPVPRSPDSLLYSSEQDLSVAVQKAKDALERTAPPPIPSLEPPRPPPDTPPASKDDSFLHDLTQCGQFLPLTEMAETVSEYLDPSKYDPTIFDPTTVFDPRLYWWETDEDDGAVFEDKPQPIVLTQRDVVLQEAASLELRGDLMGALECYKECLSMGKSRLDTAQVHHKMGVLQWKIGNYEDSLRILQKCMKLHQDAFGFYDDEDEWIVDEASEKAQALAEVLNSLGRVHLSLGHVPEADRDLKQALALIKLAHDQSDSDNIKHQEALASALARTKFGLGMVQEHKGKKLRAMKYYKEALEVHRAHDAQIDVASCLNSIGAIHEQSGEYDNAMDAYTEALMIYRAQLVDGQCSPVDVAVTLNNIGFIHHLWGEFNCSMTAYEDAVGIMESVLGPNHRNVASTRHNIGLVHVERGNYEEAKEIFKQVLQTQLEILGEGHTDVAITLDSISNAYEHLGKLDRATKYLERSLLIRQRALGGNHLLVAVTLDRLGKVDFKQGELSAAKRRFQDALRIYQANRVPQDDGRIQHVKEYLALIKKQQKRQGEGRIDYVDEIMMHSPKSVQ